MLQIRKEQMKAFENAALKRFEDKMTAHSMTFTPRLSKVLGEKQIRKAVQQAMRRAARYGFTNQGPMQLYIELMYICGSDFDTDPQYPTLGKVLNEQGDQMERADRIYRGLMDYIEKVSGYGAVFVTEALEALADFVGQPLPFGPNDFEEGLVREMQRLFPRKADYIGVSGINGLIRESIIEARQYEFPPFRGAALLVILKFAFGHGCTDDLLYPWIFRTIHDRRIGAPEIRARQLEKKSITWLNHVIGRSQKTVRVHIRETR